MTKRKKNKTLAKAQLIVLHFKVAFFNLRNFFTESFLYYRNIKFAKADLLLKSFYLLKSPYRISAEFLRSKGEKNPYTYGETPLSTWDLICKKCGILSQDVVYDLGSGTGRGCFWLTSFVGCRAVGIEIVPTFVNRARSISFENVEFIEKDFREVNLEKATFIYIAATALDEKILDELQIKKGTKVISVSQKIKGLKELGEFEAKFPWGRSVIFLALRV